MSVVLSAEEIFNMAMEIEKSGYAYYKTVADSTNDTDLRELFLYLAEQEQKHYDFFQELSKEVEELQIAGEDWEAISEYIKATTDSRFFIGEDKAIQEARKTTDVKEAIDVAIGFEKDTLLFFHEIRQVTPSKAHKATDQIIDEERRHVKQLLERKKNLT
jgi:rubrerythrin